MLDRCAKGGGKVFRIICKVIVIDGAVRQMDDTFYYRCGMWKVMVSFAWHTAQRDSKVEDIFFDDWSILVAHVFMSRVS